MKHRNFGIVVLVAIAMNLTWFAERGLAMPASDESAPYPTVATPAPVDQGLLRDRAGSTPISVTLALRLKDVSAAESLLQSINTPGDPQYHQFLSAAEFAARFAPSAADVNNLTATLRGYGLTASRSTLTTLSVTGLPADIERAFSVTLHSYMVPAHGSTRSYSFHAPTSAGTLPGGLSNAVSGLAGLDNRPRLRPLHDVAVRKAKIQPAASAQSSTINPPGELTVQDFASLYDVQPLYQRGVTGRGRTLGIVTFASFTPSDAFAYWNALGLNVNPNRITVVDVDGGPGAPSDQSGSDETTLDVEQSGGIAPGAKIIVYQGPNTNQAFIDVFAAAIDSDRADSLSVSWGDWEWYQNLENAPVTDPLTGKTVSTTQALHELFLRAAIQGQTMFAASGDGGAYDANRDFGCTPETSSPPANETCSTPLTVDYPASDTAMTAAGGTTLPGLQEYCLNAACTAPYYDVNIPHERVWGWDYLIGLCNTLGYDPYTCGIFPGGGGGGVSITFPKPIYQYGLDGVRKSEPHQSWVYGDTLLYRLPANFPGRNVPDISANADPDTGYEIYYTSDVNGFGVLTFYGGTSFVAPQMNGVTALLGQYLEDSRLGLLNFALYRVAQGDSAYHGAEAPLRAIPYGDNWYYHGRDGYNPGVGLGTLDVANFAKRLARE